MAVPPLTRYCPHLLCRPLHAAALLLSGASLMAAVLDRPSVMVPIVLLGAFVAVVLRLATAAPPTARRAAPAVRETWAYAAVGCDIGLAVAAAALSHTAFAHPGRVAAHLMWGWDGRSAVQITAVVAGALLWQVLHLQGLRPSR